MASRILKFIVATSCLSVLHAQTGEKVQNQFHTRVRMVYKISEYHSIVKKGTAFMLFMMPGAKHDHLVPIFEKLANFYHDDKATTIAAFD